MREFLLKYNFDYFEVTRAENEGGKRKRKVNAES